MVDTTTNGKTLRSKAQKTEAKQVLQDKLAMAIAKLEIKLALVKIWQ